MMCFCELPAPFQGIELCNRRVTIKFSRKDFLYGFNQICLLMITVVNKNRSSLTCYWTSLSSDLKLLRNQWVLGSNIYVGDCDCVSKVTNTIFMVINPRHFTRLNLNHNQSNWHLRIDLEGLPIRFTCLLSPNFTICLSSVGSCFLGAVLCWTDI